MLHTYLLHAGELFFCEKPSLCPGNVQEECHLYKANDFFKISAKSLDFFI